MTPAMMPTLTAAEVDAVAARFWSKTERPAETTCWLWTSDRNRSGYGRIALHGKPWPAHRVAWALVHGGVPPTPEQRVLHRCDNPPCVRPDHLFLGTDSDNMVDMIKKGRRRYCGGAEKPNAKLDDDRVKSILARLAAGERKQVIARDFGISRALVRLIADGKAWGHVPRGN